MPWIVLAITISYLAGSIPTAYIFGRWLKGIDIRKFGSGNVGATNALRILGKGAAIVILLLDILKGFLPVLFLGDLIAAKSTSVSQEFLLIILGLACICGHNWTIFLGFKGGKGVATTFGVLLALTLKISGFKAIVGLAILTWSLVFVITRIVSIASVLTAVSLPAYMFFFRQSQTLTFASVLLAIFVILRHWSNLKRAFQGKEPRLSFKKNN